MAGWGSDKSPCGENCPDPDRRQRGEDWSWEPKFNPGAPEFCRRCNDTITTASGVTLFCVSVLLIDLQGVLVHDWRVRHHEVLSAGADVPQMEQEARGIVGAYESLTWDGPLNPAEGYLRGAHAVFKQRWDLELERRELEARAVRAEQNWRATMASVNPRMNNEIEGAIETPMPGLPPWGSHSPRFPTYADYYAYYGTRETGESSSSPQPHSRRGSSSGRRHNHHSR